jgi:hypothetical protein
VNGNVNISASTASILTGASTIEILGSLTGAGTFDLTGNGILKIAGDISVTSIIAGNNGSSVIVTEGSLQNINNSYELNNLQIGTSSATRVYLNADLQIDATLNGAGTLHGGNNKLVLWGDMSVANFTVGTGSVVLNGKVNSESQHINSYSFYNLTINNVETYLNGNLIVTNNLDFNSGNISMQGYNVSISGGSVTWKGRSVPDYTAGYFITNGTGQVTMTATSSGTVFPIGASASAYNPIIVITSSGTIDAKASVSSGITDASNLPVTSEVVNVTWLVVPSASATGILVIPQWTTSQELTGFNRSYAYAGTRPSLSSSWTDPGTPTSASGSNPYTIPSAGINMTASTNYYFGIIYGLSALPVSFSAFDALYRDGSVYLNWSTVSETNNNYFDVERSINGTQWSSIANIAASGTTQVFHQYQAIDNLAGVVPSGSVYYRIKQVDYNGQFTYSTIKAVNIYSIMPSLSVFPNPISSSCIVQWDNENSANTVLKLVNINGNVLYHKDITESGMVQQHIDMSGFPEGIYFIQLSTSRNISTQTLYKVK